MTKRQIAIRQLQKLKPQIKNEALDTAEKSINMWEKYEWQIKQIRKSYSMGHTEYERGARNAVDVCLLMLEECMREIDG